MKNLKSTLLTGGVTLACIIGNISASYSQNYQWAKAVPTGVSSLKIDKDPTGHIITSGFFIDFAGIDLDYSPAAADTVKFYGRGTYLARYNHAGEINWAGMFVDNGPLGSIEIAAVQTDDTGNIYIAGSFTGEVDFDLSPLPADTTIERTLDLGGGAYLPGMYMAKYDSTGNLKWVANLFGSISSMTNMTVKNNKIYIAGKITSLITYLQAEQADVDFNPSNAPADTFFLRTDPAFDFINNPFFAVYDLNGHLKTAKRLYDGTEFNVNSIDADHQKNIYINGSLRGRHDLNPSPAAADTFFLEGVRGQFLAKYDSAGLFQWAQPVVAHDSASGDLPMLLKINGSEVYVSGQFKGTIDFDPGSGIHNLTASSIAAVGYPSQSSYLARYNTSSSFINASVIGGLGKMDQITALEVDDSGFVYIGGDFIGTADFNFSPAVADTFILRSAGNNDYPDFFFAKYKNDTLVWAKKIGNAADGQTLTGMAVGNKTVNLVGTFAGDVIFDPNPPANLASKIDGGGTYLAAYRMAPPSNAKDLLTYDFTTPAATGIITPNDSVLITVPAGTSITNLVANFTLSPEAVAHVGTTLQISSTTVNDFSGMVTYTVMAEDSSTRDYFLKVTVEPPTGIDDMSERNASFKVWPNPARDAVYFEGLSDIRLYNMQGVLLSYQTKVSTLSLKGLAAGTYIIVNEKGQRQRIVLAY